MSKRRVVITGLGVVTSLGEVVDQVWDALCAGKSGIVPIRRWDCSTYPTRFGGECYDFDLTKYKDAYARHRRSDEDEIPRNGRLDRFAQFGIAASISAANDANIDFKTEDTTRCGVIIGTGIGGIETIEEQNKILVSRGVSRVSPFTVPRLMANAASGNVSILFRLNGPNTCVSTACATGSNAIGDAGRLIQYGLADVMIAGGAEAALSSLGMSTFVAARALSTRNEEPTLASRPWDKDRDGFVQAEGAGVVILEEYEHARARGARIYAELVGYGMSGDGYHITAPDSEGRGAAAAMKLALKDAGVSGEVVDYINAHGTSTELGDLAETKAVKTTFGEHAYKMALSSTKSQLGHSLGASGGMEAVFSSLSVSRNLIPPTINLENPSPDCDLDYTPLKARDRKITYAMSNSFGFGGHNASLLFKKI
ncbi:beta-ketoacyl-ACP synthase II [Humisphaera borealis]|uniref:3-oxoacyl-[acyl-carrier-protein] synthase 2 n=1 Tax=Humisphaera borealis TaxID=2807512 RepID=A0A7M2WSA4_9BACT|nr:beta-ketoacyl-ACP synthase II [Humisphaera borealis]QOV88346.1 beta-ketoacyl-ACP synthase II [Humisphaera borealis]